MNKTNFERMKKMSIDEYVTWLNTKVEDTSDGSHTYKELYYQRAMLFAYIVMVNKDKAWKSRKDMNGKIWSNGGYFLVSVTTPDGEYGYHFKIKYWDLFECIELEKSKPYDGYTDKDVTRLFSLSDND